MSSEVVNSSSANSVPKDEVAPAEPAEQKVSETQDLHTLNGEDNSSLGVGFLHKLGSPPSAALTSSSESDGEGDIIKGYGSSPYEVTTRLHINAPQLGIIGRCGIDYLPRQVEKLACKTGAKFTMILAGQSGLGKTSFINTLFDADVLAQEELYETPVSELKPKATTCIREHRVELFEKNFNLHFTCVDTPGFGDYENNKFCWYPVVRYIEEQFRRYAYQEVQPDRSQMVDTRVHACLYFLVPSPRVSALDVEAMSELSKRVNLIPIIAKADSYTTEELRDFKAEFKATVDKYDIKLCDWLEKEYVDRDVLDLMPFSVINGNTTITKLDGSTVRGREYVWGFAEVENLDHCDFVLLRELLMGTNILDFIMATEAHYEQYRSEFLNMRSKKGLEALGKTISDVLNSIDLTRTLNAVPIAELEKEVVYRNPAYLSAEKMIKKTFSETVMTQESNFKEWKAALHAKQTHFNDDIQELHNKVLRLQEDIKIMEAVN